MVDLVSDVRRKFAGGIIRKLAHVDDGIHPSQVAGLQLSKVLGQRQWRGCAIADKACVPCKNPCPDQSPPSRASSIPASARNPSTRRNQSQILSCHYKSSFIIVLLNPFGQPAFSAVFSAHPWCRLLLLKQSSAAAMTRGSMISQVHLSRNCAMRFLPKRCPWPAVL